jgi:hypothetical protein
MENRYGNFKFEQTCATSHKITRKGPERNKVLHAITTQLAHARPWEDVQSLVAEETSPLSLSVMTKLHGSRKKHAAVPIDFRTRVKHRVFIIIASCHQGSLGWLVGW